ncbi:MAG: radical SAM protein, partial [Nanoarchaeota archaeon]
MKNKLAIAVNESEWKDWKWQQRNSLHSAKQIKRFFPNFPEEELSQINEYDQKRRWGITPYTLSLMSRDKEGNPSHSDPLVKQTFPLRGFRIDVSKDSYDGSNESNWELPHDMVTPIMQHKYTNKVIIRAPNSCLGYCGFCFEVARVEDKTTKKGSVNDQLWKQSMDYVRTHLEVIEVILSGGDPLLSNNDTLEGRLSDIRSIQHVKAVRVHTRALTFNPFRIDEKLIGLFKKYRVNALGVHVCHPNELTEEMNRALNLFDNLGYGSIIKLGQTPLLRGINDDSEVLKELFMKMYSGFNIKPYYLFHS